MPDPSGQKASTIAFDKVTTLTTPTTLTTELRLQANSDPNKIVLEFWAGLDPLAVRKSDSFTLTSATPTLGDTVTVSVTVGAAQEDYTYVVETGDTQAIVIANLMAVANTDSNVIFTSVGNVITATSAIAGQAYTLAVARTGTSITLGSVTVITANAGTAAHGKIAELEFRGEASTDGFFAFPSSVRLYNGAVSPVLQTTLNNAAIKHILSIGAIQALRGL
jgi:hypothetical protein